MKLRMLLAATALFAASPSSAAMVLYTITGTGSAATDGGFYSGDFSITGIGDTSVDLNPDPTVTAYFLSSFQISFSGGQLYSSQPIAIWTQSSTVGLVQSPGPPVLTFPLLMSSPVISTYDLATSLDVTPVNFVGAFDPFQTDKGQLVVQGALTNLTFSAQLLTDAVPEPDSWALMLAGFAISGAAIRHRRRVTFAKAAAA